MKWLKPVFKHLKSTFGNKPFSAREALELLRVDKAYSKNTAYQVLHQLVKRGLLLRISRGIYKVPDRQIAARRGMPRRRKTIELTSDILKTTEKTLEEKGIDFMITGPSILIRYHHLLPRRLMHLVYVIKGSGEFALSSLRENKFHVLLEPTRKEVETFIEAFENGDLLIIREFSELEGNMNGRACIEKALVDTYFESTRRRIPFSEVEVGRIITNVYRREHVDVKRLFKLAGRRGIKGEFRMIVREIDPSIPIIGEITVNECVENVLRGIRR